MLLHRQAGAFRFLKRIDEARAVALKALAFTEDCKGKGDSYAEVLHTLADISMSGKDFDAALKCSEEALVLYSPDSTISKLNLLGMQGHILEVRRDWQGSAKVQTLALPLDQAPDTHHRAKLWAQLWVFCSSSIRPSRFLKSV